MRIGLAGVVALATACGGDDAPPAGGDAGGDGGAAPDALSECPATPPAECDLFLGCCEDPLLRCGLVGGQRTCVAPGAGQHGDACLNEAGCAPGTTCLVYYGEQQCLALCDDTHPCGAGLYCYIGVNDMMGNVTAKVCGQVCTPLDQDCAYAGQGCYLDSRVDPDHGICVMPGAGQQGDACARSNDCVADFVCISSTSTCAQMCDRVDGDPACATGTCEPLTGHTQTGACLP